MHLVESKLCKIARTAAHRDCRDWIETDEIDWNSKYDEIWWNWKTSFLATWKAAPFQSPSTLGHNGSWIGSGWPGKLWKTYEHLLILSISMIRWIPWSSMILIWSCIHVPCMFVLMYFAWCMYIVITDDFGTHKLKPDKDSGLLSKCITTSMQHAPSCTTVTLRLSWCWEFSLFRIGSLLFKELGEDWGLRGRFCRVLSGVVTIKADSPVSQGACDPTWCSSRLRGRLCQMDELKRQPIFIINHPLVTLADSH